MKQMAKDLPIINEAPPNCQACHYGKQSSLPFPKATWRASHKLQLIHTDLAGPQKTPSPKGSLYYIIFIDDMTRICWIYFLKRKSEDTGTFWNFKKRIENQSGRKIQTLRSNNGKEYTFEQFNMFCNEAGIEHHLTAPYTPQHNGVSERRNGHIMDMTRCMLHEKNLPKNFWAEAGNTTVFLQIKLSTKVVKD